MKYFVRPSTFQGFCPGAGILGPQPGALHTNTSKDPFERLFQGSTYTFGGHLRYTTSIASAIKAFTEREYPDVGGKGLKIVPDLPSPQEDISWADLSKHCIADRHGGLVQGNLQMKHQVSITLVWGLRATNNAVLTYDAV